MLLELAQWLEQYARAFNVFSYLTLRAVLACLTALIISFVVGPGLIRRLTVYKIGQSVRDDGPQTHLVKTGTPTMGGALILVSVAVTTLLWAGINTDRCVFSSLQDAGFLGYDSVLLADACGTPSPAYVTRSIHFLVQQLHGFVATTPALLAALSPAPPTTRS